MFPPDVPTVAASLPAPSAASTTGFFTKGNPVGPVPATILDQDFMNMSFLELINVVIAGGLTPSKTVYTQVRDAILAMIASSTGTALLKANNLSDLASVATALANLGISLQALSRMWVLMQNTGANPTILNSFGFGAGTVTRTGTGLYQVAFAAALATANYFVKGSGTATTVTWDTATVNGFRLVTRDPANGNPIDAGNFGFDLNY